MSNEVFAHIFTDEFTELDLAFSVQDFLHERFGIDFYVGESEDVHFCFDLMNVIDSHMVKEVKAVV